MSTGAPQENVTGPLRIFVAMPGSEMGSDATWTDPDQIKRFFYEKIAERVRGELGLPVELVIEKDKYLAGPIYSSMYSEAWSADVYLADLTGGNANVYLELGVRWAMSDGVTILLAQDPSKLKFNVAATRAEPYSIDPDVRERSIDRVVRSIVEGLRVKKRGGTDSPVRENGKVLSVSAAELVDLRSELDRLRAERGENYLVAAASAPTLQTKIDLLRRAVDVNPLVAVSRFQLGLALRESGSADAEAIEQLERAAHLSPDVGGYRRELGVALSKSGRPSDAVPALQRAVELDPADYDALSALGGAQRRLALAGGPDAIDGKRLEAARDSYDRAAAISPRDTYPLLNVARIDMLLSRRDPARRETARAQFSKVLPLCQYELQEATEVAGRAGSGVKEKQDAAYKAFDHADCLLFSGRTDDGLDAYRTAIAAVPADLRQDILRSVAAGLDSIDAIASLEDDIAEAVRQVRSLLVSG